MKLDLRIPKKGLQTVVPLAVAAAGSAVATERVDELPATKSPANSMAVALKCSLDERIPLVGSESILSLPVPHYEEWGEKEEKEFQDLAMKEALQTISTLEGRRLEELGDARSRLKHRSSFEELLFYAKQEQARVELLEAMRHFLVIHHAPRWKGAKRNK